MRVFITGGTGFVGAHLLAALSKAGHQVTALVRSPGFTCPFPDVETLNGHLEDFDLIDRALAGHDAVIHNALIWEDEFEMRDTRASARLFDAAGRAGVEQIIYTSSTAVHRPFSALMDEDSPAETNDWYGATKRCSELLLHALSHQSPVRGNVIRAAPVVGTPAYPGAAHKSDARIAEIVRRAKSGEAIPVPQGGRQFVGAEDLARLFIAVLQSKSNRQTILGVSREAIAWSAVAREAVRLTGSASEVYEEGEPMPDFRFDPAKLERDHGFRFNALGAMCDHIRHLAVS